MRLRNITGSREVIAESPYVVPEDTLEACPGTWHEIFGNDHPIHIEIGMELKNIPAYCSARSRKWKRTSFPT